MQRVRFGSLTSWLVRRACATSTVQEQQARSASLSDCRCITDKLFIGLALALRSCHEWVGAMCCERRATSTAVAASSVTEAAHLPFLTGGAA